MLGKVKWFSRERGYGFITGDDNGVEYFVLYKEIKMDDKYRELFDGEEVEFDVGEDAQARLRAENVRLLKSRTKQTSMPSEKTDKTDKNGIKII